MLVLTAGWVVGEVSRWKVNWVVGWQTFRMLENRVNG